MPSDLDYFYFYDSVDWDQYGPVEFTIFTNQFTFNMRTGTSISGGHVVFKWQCMDSESLPKENSYENLCINQVEENVNYFNEMVSQGQQIENDGFEVPVGSFQTQLNTIDVLRLSGTVTLENYPNMLNCHYEVKAGWENNLCKEIKITLRDVAVESEMDHFRFSWEDSDGYHITPPRSGCYGDGCSKSLRRWST